MLADYFSRQEKEKREMRQLVEIVTQGHHNTQEARKKLQQMKARIGNNLITASATTSINYSPASRARKENTNDKSFGGGVACFEAKHHLCYRVCRRKKKCAAR